MAYLCGLLFFHQQARLPEFWLSLSSRVETAPALSSLWMLTGLLLWRFPGRCKTLFATTVLLLSGLLFAQFSAGIQAAAHLQMQVPLSCNKTVIQSEFILLEKAFRDEDSQSWIVRHDPPATAALPPCLKKGARLQVFIEKASRFSGLLPGEKFMASFQVKPARTMLQLEGFDMHRHWFAERIAGTAELKGGIRETGEKQGPHLLDRVQRIRLAVAQWIAANLDGHPELPLVLAMVVGDQGLISPEDREMYSNTGIAHLVAISGLHITLLALVAGKMASRAWRCSARLCLLAPAPLVGAGIGLLLGIFYGLVAGWGIPAQRTVFMLAALFAGQLRGGLMNSWDSFFLAMLLAVMLDNWSVLDAGFLLSFGAVGVLIFANQGHLDFTRHRLEFLRKAVKAQYAVTIGLVLPTAILFNQQSLVSPLVNALSIPWMSFVSTPLALLGGLLQLDWAVRLSADSLALQRIWLLESNSLDWAVLPLHSQPTWVYALVGLGCLVLLLPAGLINRGIGFLLLGFLAWPPARPESGSFWLTVLDVGQGTAIAVQTRHHLVIYDAGPAFNPQSDSSRRVILPWLFQQGYSRPDLFMLSHEDADHAGGAPLLISKAPPRLFASSIPAGHSLNRQARNQQGKVADCHSLPEWTWDGVLFQPLGLGTPPPGDKKHHQKNNRSCVLKISNRKHSILLTGDIEVISEMQLLARHGAAALKARVLLAPHHGSKTSSTLPFLQAVQAEHVLIQAGWENRFGHPHPQVTKRYELLGASWTSTAQHGALHWKFLSSDDTSQTSTAIGHRRRYWHLHEKGAKP